MSSPKPEFEPLKTDKRLPNTEAPLRDLGIRLVMIPAFGVVIPHATGYFGPYGAAQPTYWLGLLWGILVSATIWHGNRWLLLKQRQYYDWFRHGARKVIFLAFACVFYTAPVTVLMMLGWYWFAGFGPEWHVIRVVTLCCVICVAFITHAYETVYLIQQRGDDLVAVAQSERARMQAELDALRAQVAPHFLFNSLNTLSWLIEHHPGKALDFNQDLAEVYRYILVSRRTELMPLDQELRFVQQYFRLVQLRFENSVFLRLPDPDNGAYIPPIAIQMLVENALKHNRHSAREPLAITVHLYADFASVENLKRPQLAPQPGAGSGLATLDSRCRLVLGRGIDVIDRDDSFEVRVPIRRERS